MFQSAGEHAWRILGIKNDIISGQELYRIEDILINELLQCKKGE